MAANTDVVQGSANAARALRFLLLTLALAACGPAPARVATGPKAPVRAEVERAHTQEAQRQYERARSHYERAIALAADPVSRAYAHREFASALIFWGEYPGAQRELGKSLDADPRQVQAWHDLGVLQAQSHDDVAALASLERALRLAPDEPRTRIALAALLVRTGEFRAAQTHYQTLLRLDLPPKIAKAIRRALAMLRVEIARENSQAAKPVPPGP